VINSSRFSKFGSFINGSDYGSVHDTKFARIIPLTQIRYVLVRTIKELSNLLCFLSLNSNSPHVQLEDRKNHANTSQGCDKNTSGKNYALFLNEINAYTCLQSVLPLTFVPSASISMSLTITVSFSNG